MQGTPCAAEALRRKSRQAGAWAGVTSSSGGSRFTLQNGGVTAPFTTAQVPSGVITLKIWSSPTHCSIRATPSPRSANSGK
jgi:hypothetical protein